MFLLHETELGYCFSSTAQILGFRVVCLNNNFNALGLLKQVFLANEGVVSEAHQFSLSRASTHTHNIKLFFIMKINNIHNIDSVLKWQKKIM